MSAADGVSVAVPAPELYDTEAATAPPPDVGESVKVAVVIVAAVIASLNVTTTVEFTATFVAPLTGVTAVTVGGVMSGADAVVNADEKAVRPLLARSFAPLVTLTV
jgi:hypothetical protein